MFEKTILNPAGVGLPNQTRSQPAIANYDDPSLPIQAYLDQAGLWSPVIACMGGNDFLNHVAASYIPKLAKEKDPCYARRLSIATFSPYLRRIINAAVGLILRKPIRLEAASEADQAYWDDWAMDVDRQGTSLNAFAIRNLEMAIAYGHAGILAAWPNAPDAPRTLADEQQNPLRPYLCQVSPQQMIGWRVDSRAAGAQLQQVRIMELATVPEGKYGVKTYQQVRILEPGTYEVLRSNVEATMATAPAGGDRSWQEVPGAEGQGRTGLSYIPLGVTYAGKLETLVSRPPLIDVAYLNLRHYRLQSKHLHALEVAGFPLLVLMGWDDQSDGLDADVTSALALPPEGSANYIGPDPGSFGPTAEALADLVSQMKNLGIAILAEQKNVAETEGSKQLDRADTTSLAAIISLSLQQALQKTITACAEMRQIDPPEVQLDRDFDLQTLDPSAMKAIIDAAPQPLFDRQTALEMLQRGERLSSDREVDEILQRVEDEENSNMQRELDKSQQELQAMQAMKAESEAPDQDE